MTTIKKAIAFSGVGIHTGKEVTLRFVPARVGEGIRFRRVDLPERPFIPASVDYVVATNRSTTLGLGPVEIHTVEHVLAAVRACEINDLVIEVSSIEPPIGNGSADVFVEMIEEVGLAEEGQHLEPISLQYPVYWSKGDVTLVAIPSEEYRISYTLSYPDSKVLKAQFFSVAVTPENFRREIASCRTFANYEEISHLMDRGLIKGGSLDNAVIIKDEAVFSKAGLFFSDEMVRHKILDVIGDLSLVGIPFLAHVIAIRSGHSANCAFAAKLRQSLLNKEPIYHG